MSESAQLHAGIHGRVQGVFFRAFVSDLCHEMELTGYVRNLRDGSVEVVAEGDKSKLEKLLVHLKEGPPGARVVRVKTVWSQFTGNYPDFRIRT